MNGEDPNAKPENQAPTAPPPDYAGYPSVDALAKGYRESSAEAKKWRDAALSLNQQLQGASPHQDIPHRTRPEDQLGEVGIPVDPIREIIRAEIQQGLAPLVSASMARNRVSQRYSDFGKYEGEVARFVESDPELSATYAAMTAPVPGEAQGETLRRVEGALRFAYLAYAEDQRGKNPPPKTDNGQELADAALPGARSGDSRRVDQTGQAEVQEALERVNKDPSRKNVEAYAHSRLRQVVPESFLRQ
jgi:hypothetical protein